MKLEEYFKIKDTFEITLINNVFAFLSVENDELIIEVSRDKNFFEKINLEGKINIDFDTEIQEVKDIIIDFILNRYIIEHM